MTNLFKGWDRDSIAVAAEDIQQPDYSVCVKFYRLGAEECRLSFPFNLKSRKSIPASGELNMRSGNQGSSYRISNQSKLQRLYYSFIEYTGLIHYRNKLEISDSLLKWIKDFAPEVIYTQLSNYRLINFVTELHDRLGYPIAIHIMDDWPVSISNKGIFQNCWRNKIGSAFRKLVEKSAILLSISDSMSEEYQKRYGRPFIPFHNPIETAEWLKHSRTEWSMGDKVKMLYTGRIGTANNQSIFFISRAIHELNLSGQSITLDIYTPDHEGRQAEELSELRGIAIKKTVAHSEMPHLLSSHDILILPLDFDRKGIEFARYSMPTKASEYMISGTPILVFASKETGLAKYAEKEKWAYLVSEFNADKLTAAIRELITKEEMRMLLANRAKALAMENENAETVRERFRQVFVNYRKHN